MTDLQIRTDAERMACDKLIAALPAIVDRDALQQILDWLEARQILQDGQEDPGAVETDGLALELAVANAFRRMAEALRREMQTGM
ncbi:hypothetical protein RGQ15_15070 [Paracoccus sp. MBLB3053]|uniref:Uncharacterized protein n=1 Tax=Paracoccus aurantius TaxID=3073814 RepID=A0ABU2HV03_9RHOB|nr:hypothetical protein [Paracoccus sp. MBLB3053]MDS9468886.1 hypothetical protein [Paracoccus sp. MBLB3053]